MGEDDEQESIKEKRATCIRLLKNIQLHTCSNKMKNCFFARPIHTSVRLNAIFNLMKRFLNLYIDGFEPLNQQVEFSMLFISMFHTEILFHMALIEVASNDLQQYVQSCLMYKQLELLCTIASKCSKSL